MTNPITHEEAFRDAVKSIRTILNSRPLPMGDDSEKLVRIVWALKLLPKEFQEAIFDEATNRVFIGGATGMKPTDQL